jgi:branched-chain amino acid transport system ATP-binding protein
MALSLADRAYLLETGRVMLSGDAAALRADPRVREAYLGVEA